jgi:calcineurin-like phosphoesterase family protein
MGTQARVVAYRCRIRCRRTFAVPGNHDRQARRLKEDFLWLDNLAEVSIHGQPIVLCHYALPVWNRSNRGSWHLFGHSHGRLPEVPHSLSMDVGVEHARLPSMALRRNRRYHEEKSSGSGVVLRSLAIPARASSHRQESRITMRLLVRTGSFRRR